MTRAPIGGASGPAAAAAAAVVADAAPHGVIDGDASVTRLVRTVARALVAASVGRALLAGLAVATMTWLMARSVPMLVPRGSAIPTVPMSAAALVALLAGLAVGWRIRAADGRMTPRRAALWIEEQRRRGGTSPLAPFALVTLVDVESGLIEASPVATMRLRRSVITGDVLRPGVLRGPLRAWAWRRLRMPLASAIIAAGALASTWWIGARVRADGTMRDGVVDAEQAPSGAPVPAIGAWRVRVVPPAYTQRAAVAVDDPSLVRVLDGSRVEWDGRIPAGADSLRLSWRRIGGGPDVSPPRSAPQPQPLPHTMAADGRWRTAITAPGGALELRARRGDAARLLLVDGIPDSLPTVTLRLPARDTILRRATGTIPLSAQLRDDIGLVDGAIEVIITSGEGEVYTARTARLGARRLGGAREATLAAALPLDSLGLGPGDLLHLRAVARDGHPDGSRGVGASETRTIRIARRDEYDSLAVEPAAPPAVDSSLLSQRMLLLRTERLEAQRPSLARDVLTRESRALAADQARLRLAVGALVFQRADGESSAEHVHFAGDGHDHGLLDVGGKLVPTVGSALAGTDVGDSPVVAIDRPLLEAYNAMWDAGRALEQAEPGAAIPPMRSALAAIERARAASRLYLRGRPPRVVVDLAKVRLAGRDTGSSNARSTRPAVDATARWREARLLRAAALLSTAPDAARDSLAVLRLDATGDAPAFAAALSEVLRRLARGDDVTDALVQARRRVAGPPTRAADGWWRGVP